MKKWLKKKLFLGSLLFFCFPAQSLQAKIYVISNPGLNIAADDIKSIFTGETQFSGSQSLDITDNSAAQSEFLQKVMGISQDDYVSLWVKKAFRDGVNQPPARGNDAEVLDFVKNTPGAVGYVSSPPPEGVKIISSF